MFLRSSPLQLHTTLWSPSPQSLFNLINLIWCLIWTDRCSCPHWETVRLNMFKSILISLCLSGMKTLTHNLCSHVNIYTYTGLKLGCLQFLKRQQNYLSAQGAERERERGGEACRGTNALLSLYSVQITKQASIRGALIRLQCDCLLSVTDDQLFGLSKQTNRT